MMVPASSARPTGEWGFTLMRRVAAQVRRTGARARRRWLNFNLPLFDRTKL
jgi:hypothetical protein